MKIRMSDDNSALEISGLYLGIVLRADHAEKKMIVCERDSELIFKTTKDGGETWSEFREI